ncbi:SH3 domain-containing protein [Ochrobactrum sp. CM-21-5]|nr:SH3 domain-containing protein [Ochrobactrum sp. CM-21-5]MBC2884121.1 SH3 domain-containing protein [Ochrobactrum sp. CM-21-5]
MFLIKKVLVNGFLFGAATFASIVSLPAVASAAPAVVSATVNVRAGPGANYARLATLPAWARVNAGPCQRGWCQIRGRGYSGWVSGRYIRFGGGYIRQPSRTVIIEGGWGRSWGPDWGPSWRRGYYRPCTRNGCISSPTPPVPRYDPSVPYYDPYRNTTGSRGWNPLWGIGPQRGPGWGHGPRPFRDQGHNRGGIGGGFHIGEGARPMHSGR